MTTTLSYTEISLSHTDTNSTGSPYTSPIFTGHFRSVEKMWHSARVLQDKTEEVLHPEWAQSDEIHALLEAFEHRNSLQLVHAAMTTEKPLFERAIYDLSCKLDPRFNRCSEANCMAGFLQDGVKIDVIKARALMTAVTGIMAAIEEVLVTTEEAACKARDFITREANKAATGQTDFSLMYELNDKYYTV